MFMINPVNVPMTNIGWMAGSVDRHHL